MTALHPLGGPTLAPDNNSFWDNEEAPPDPYMPRYPKLVEFSETYGAYHGYFAAVICVWGIAANLANIIVLTRKNMISSTNLILTWLAVADLLTMTSYLPVSIHFYIMIDPRLKFPATPSLHWIRFMLFHINFAVVCHTVAIWLTITLAIFRYLFICYPTRGMELCSMLRSKIAIILNYVSVVIICIPNSLITCIIKENRLIHEDSLNHTTGNISHSQYNFTYYNFAETSIAHPFLFKFNYWIQAILIKMIPCILLVVLTICLIVAMHQANKRRMKLKSQGKKDESDRAREHNRTTGMLLAIVGLFLLTELPQGILTLCNIFIPNFYMDVYWPLGDVLDMLAMINNSINFVLYCTMSRQFRDTFMDVFCSCCPRHRPGWLKLKTFTVTSNGTSQSTV